MLHRNLEKTEKPMKSKKSHKTEHSRENALTEDELEELLSATDDILEKLYIVASGYEGMRESEIAHMNDTWIDFQSKIPYIIIPSEQKCSCGECVSEREGIWTPKTVKGARKIPIRKKALPIFQKYFGAYHKVGKSRQTIWKHIVAIAKKTTITKRVYPHSLRATSATLWANMGLPANVLKTIMGWENIETANKYLGSDGDSALREAKYWEEKYEDRALE